MDNEFDAYNFKSNFSVVCHLYREMSYQALMNGPEWKFRDIYRYNKELRVKHGLEMSRLFLN